RLVDLYKRQAEYPEAADAMHRELNLMPDSEERRGRLVEYAALLGVQLGDISGATGALQGVTSTEPAHAGALALLPSLLTQSQDPAVSQALFEMLRTGLKAAGRYQELVGLLEERAL